MCADIASRWKMHETRWNSEEEPLAEEQVSN